MQANNFVKRYGIKITAKIRNIIRSVQVKRSTAEIDICHPRISNAEALQGHIAPVEPEGQRRPANTAKYIDIYALFRYSSDVPISVGCVPGGVKASDTRLTGVVS
jgi:hypothetical protein